MRQLEAPGSPQAHRQALACLAPWMDNLSFAARWEGENCTSPNATWPGIWGKSLSDCRRWQQQATLQPLHIGR